MHLSFGTELQNPDITPDRKFAMLEGSHTGVPVAELIPAQAPPGATGPTLPTHQPPPALPGMRVQKDIFSLKQGKVVLFWPSPLSEDSVQDVSDWLEIVKRKFKRAVANTEPSRDS